MALRSLLDTLEDNADLGALAAAVGAGEAPHAHMSSGVRPLLLAALSEDPRAFAGRPILFVAADDRGARDLARELGAFLAPRRVRYYPSRGTGYESHLTPPPHLVGLRIAALDALVGDRDRADDRDAGPPIVVASAVALAEAVPDASLRPAGFTLHRGEEIDLDDVAELLAGAGYEHVEQVTDRGQFAVRGGILDVFGSTEDRAARVELFGDEIESIRYFSTFTQRSLGEAERIELDPAAEIDPDHRLLAEAALEDAAADDRAAQPLAELLPTDRFAAFLDLIAPSTALVIAAAEDLDGALSDHLSDVRAAIHDDDVAQLYVEVSAPLSERAELSVSARESGQEHSFRASTPVSAARSLAEAEPELEKQVRSGYLTVVAFERRGEADRARYGLDRTDAEAARRRPWAGRPGPSLRRGLDPGGLHRPGAEARRDPVPQAGPPAPLGGAGADPRAAREHR